MATIQNIVSTANLQRRLDLGKLGEVMPDSEYNPKKFNGLIVKITNPKSTILVFSTGKIVCTGTKTLEDNDTVITKLIDKFSDAGYTCTKSDVSIENIVGSGTISSHIDLQMFARTYWQNVIYTPELFPGLKFSNFEKHKGTAIVFNNGKIIVTGFKTEPELQRFYKKTKLIAMLYAY